MVDLKLHFPDGFFDEEVRCGYTVTKETKKLWAVQLDLLAELDRVCKQYDIQYMACGGTMLGAVRHQGFIPWDDDIDVMMTWENYKKLCEIGQEVFKFPYFFQTDYTDRGSIRGHVQIRNCKTTAILSSESDKEYQFNQGIFIDVFCLDHIPDNTNERAAFFEEVKKRKKRLNRIAKYTYRYTEPVRSSSQGCERLAKDILHFILLKLKSEEKAYERFEETIHKNNGISTKEMGIIPIVKLGERYCWKRDDIETELQYLPFEFMQVPVPANYENILKKTYGNWQDYVVGTSNHSELIIDLDKPYTFYLQK